MVIVQTIFSSLASKDGGRMPLHVSHSLETKTSFHVSKIQYALPVLEQTHWFSVHCLYWNKPISGFIYTMRLLTTGLYSLYSGNSLNSIIISFYSTLPASTKIGLEVHPSGKGVFCLRFSEVQNNVLFFVLISPFRGFPLFFFFSLCPPFVVTQPTKMF